MRGRDVNGKCRREEKRKRRGREEEEKRRGREVIK